MKRFVAAVVLLVSLWGASQYVHRTFYEVPVLMYHHIDVPVTESGNFVRPDSFEKQMEFLKLHRYHVVPLRTVFEDLKSGKLLPQKTVAITFDDGSLDNFRHAFPVLRKMGFPATIFMITANIGKPGWLSSEDLKILDESGIEIGSHTVNHAFLPELTSAEARLEITQSKIVLETLLGHEVSLFSYPAGGVTPEIEALVREAGYDGAVTTNYGKPRHQPYALHRVKVSDSARNLFNFWAKNSGFYRVGKKTVSYPGA